MLIFRFDFNLILIYIFVLFCLPGAWRTNLWDMSGHIIDVYVQFSVHLHCKTTAEANEWKKL